MRHEMDDNVQPIFNDIRIDLRNNGLNNNQPSIRNDQRSQGSVPSRISRYSGKIKYKYDLIKILFLFKEYPQVRPTNPLYTSHSIVKTQSSNSKSSATLVNRRQKFDPQAPRRPSDWRWLAILCIILFFPLGMLIQLSISSFIINFFFKVYLLLHLLVKHKLNFVMDL
jgi:hypothetical protein